MTSHSTAPSRENDRYESLDPATIARLGPLIRREPRGMALLHHGINHRGQSVCPGADCGLDLMTVGITSLAYVFETCNCPRIPYAHLVEQLWHRDCLVDA